LRQGEELSDGGLFGKTAYDEDAVKEKLRNELASKLGRDNISLGDGQELPIDKVDDYEAMRLTLSLQEAELSDTARQAIEEKRNALLQPAYKQWQVEENLREMVKQGYPDSVGLSSPLVRGQDKIVFSGETLTKQELTAILEDNNNGYKDEILDGLEADDRLGAQLIPVNDELYFALLIMSVNGGYTLKGGSYYEVRTTNDKITLLDKVDELPEVSRVSFVQAGDCSNPYKKPEVRYYESEPNKGMPAIVPFDLDDGWYAKISQTTGWFGSDKIEGYEDSGAVTFFYICNVGSNGREENMKGDDICQSFNIHNYEDVDFRSCPSLTKREIGDLAERAQRAIREAQQQYGSSTITILGNRIDSGRPMAGDYLADCQDFMSPEDCQLLFNVCDPVICPPSRCNLGGKYHVSNVAQTGIIGSIMLCLPNFPEVKVPVCLTGIHAGIDSYVSILKSERECLQASLDSGQHVGICDMFTSIYMCEFFWRQIAPFIDLIIPRIIEMSYGQGTQGGGEYLTVMHSWNTLQKGISYFKDEYAQNAFNAFRYRNIEEVGTEFCRAFIGTSMPSSADAIESLLEPESPHQMYGYFDEIEFTEATVPATSQYKIYYHIYAGNDRGAQYAVYLRNPPASSYYQSRERIMVDSGYIPRGESADRTKDLTAPAGYKELCISVNAQEECGFKQVTTNFALDYLQDKYVEEQVMQKEITTEKECISGSPSLLGAVSPNIQAGLEEASQPRIDLRGITRICASENPGKSVDVGDGSDEDGEQDDNQQVQKQRWVKVGYCGDPNIGCWLDTASVRDDVERVYAVENKTLKQAENRLGGLDDDNVMNENETVERLGNLAGYIGEYDGSSNLDNIEDIGELQEKVEEIVYNLEDIGGSENVYGRGANNQLKAKAIMLRARVYAKAIKQIWLKSLNKQYAQRHATSRENGDGGDEESGSGSEGDEQDEERDGGEDGEDEDDGGVGGGEGEQEQQLEKRQTEFELTLNGQTYYLKWGKPHWYSYLNPFSDRQWLFRLNEQNEWREITSSNGRLGFLSGLDYEKGVGEIKQKGEYLGESEEAADEENDDKKTDGEETTIEDSVIEYPSSEYYSNVDDINNFLSDKDHEVIINGDIDILGFTCVACNMNIKGVLKIRGDVKGDVGLGLRGGGK
ncbi:MAG: hypothetical protein ACP5D2_02990, partial [Candidatus Nanoarchaeia archaeon]